MKIGDLKFLSQPLPATIARNEGNTLMGAFAFKARKPCFRRNTFAAVTRLGYIEYRAPNSHTKLLFALRAELRFGLRGESTDASVRAHL